jgi:hypothetical protein
VGRRGSAAAGAKLAAGSGPFGCGWRGGAGDKAAGGRGRRAGMGRRPGGRRTIDIGRRAAGRPGSTAPGAGGRQWRHGNGHVGRSGAEGWRGRLRASASRPRGRGRIPARLALARAPRAHKRLSEYGQTPGAAARKALDGHAPWADADVALPIGPNQWDCMARRPVAAFLSPSARPPSRRNPSSIGWHIAPRFAPGARRSAQGRASPRTKNR